MIQPIRALMLATLLIPSAALAEQATDADALTDVYLFTSVEVSKHVRNELLPVVGAAKKRLVVETQSGALRRVKFTQGGISSKPELVTSSLYAELSPIKFDLQNRAAERRTARLENTLDDQVDFAEATIAEIDSGNSPTVAGQPQGVSKEAYRQDLANTVHDSSSLREDLRFAESTLADTIYASVEVTPRADIAEAYGLVLATAQGSTQKSETVALSLQYLGNLQAGVPNKVDFMLATKEQRIHEPKFTFFLFAGDGSPIATNQSPRLKQLTAAELQSLQQSQTQ